MTQDYIEVQFTPTAEAIGLVREFQEKFGTPKLETALTMIVEESTELLGAIEASNKGNLAPELEAEVLKEACDLAYVAIGFCVAAEPWGVMLNPQSSQGIAKTLGMMADRFGGDKVLEAFKRVHASNMSKLGDDGQPVRREDGKVLKGPNYKPPSLIDLVIPGRVQ